MSIPAAIDKKTYRLPADLAADYPCGPAVLVAVDTKLMNGVYVTNYAPVADTVSGVDMTMSFWDSWREVVPS